LSVATCGGGGLDDVEDSEGGGLDDVEDSEKISIPFA
jgi:hypothetical protein